VGDVTDELLLDLHAILMHVNVKMLSEGNNVLHFIGIGMMRILCRTVMESLSCTPPTHTASDRLSVV